MDEKTRMEYLRRVQEGMRPLSEVEIAELQNKNAPLMMNCQDPMRGGQGMQNFWNSEPGNCIPEKPKPTLWQKVKRTFGYEA